MSDGKKNDGAGGGSGEPGRGGRKGPAKKGADPAAEDAKVLGETKPKPIFTATTRPEPKSGGADEPAKTDAEAATGPAKTAEAAAKAAASADAKTASKPEPSSAAPKTEKSRQWAEEAKAAQGASRVAEAPAPKSSGGGAFSAFLYALIGGLIGGGGVYYASTLTQAEQLPAPSEIATTASVTQAVEQRVEVAAAALRESAAATEARLAALATEVEGLGAAPDGLAALETELDTLRRALATERTRVTRLNDELAERERERVAAVSAIREQVASLAAAVTATPGAALAAESSAEGAPAAGASAADATRLALLEGGLRRIEARVNGLSAEALPTPDLTRIDQLEAADETLTASLGALEGRLNAVETAARSAVQGQAATGVAYAALAEAVAGSSPYAAPLATLRDVAGLASVDPALSDPAESGLTSDVALAARFDEAARRALDAAARDRRERGEAGVADRLSGLFTIRRVVEPGDESEGEEAVLARAEARIDEGDVHAALRELEDLPSAAQEAMGDWISAAERRAAAETAMEGLRAQLLGVRP